MNANIKKMAKNRLDTTRLGRILRRFCSEESGQGAMEYVVLATLICAAIAVGIWLFGSQILGMFQSAGDAAIADHKAAETKLRNLRNTKTDADEAGKDADNNWTTEEGVDEKGGGAQGRD